MLLALALPAAAPADGVTNSGGDGRTGWYPDQASLDPAQVAPGGNFGQLWKASVDGQVYAQPLVAGGTLVVATENDQVYGLDPATGTQWWHTSVGTPFDVQRELGCADLTPNIGITSTPVVDTATRTIYTVAKSYVSGSAGAVQYQMHALDLDSGAEKPGFPVTLDGTADNAPGQTFNARTQLQRPGLLLMNGVVYAAFGSHCDFTPWQGWVFGVSTSGAVKARWVDVASGNGAGIWQSGSGLASDGPGRIEFGTGNGGAPNAPTVGTSPPSNLGESVVRLQVQPDGTLKAADFFAPADAANLDTWDADFASGGLVVLPDAYFGTPTVPHLALAVGKEGYVYLMNRDDLGGMRMGPSGSDKVVQRLGPNGGVWSRPGVWPGDGGWIYIPTASGGNSAGGSSGFLKVYSYGVTAAGNPALTLQATSADAFGFTSSAPVITSDGTRSGSALVWMIWSPNATGVGAQLRAYDPVPVGGRPQLRNSWPIGTAAKFAMPGVGGGRVYVGTRDGHVLAFGSPVDQPVTGPSLTFPSTTVGATSTRTMTLTASGDVTVNDLVTDNAVFSVDKSGLTLPATLHAGDTLSFPVTFAPSAATLYGGSLTARTDGGDVPFGLTGNGVAAGPQLSVSPPAVSFGGAAVGGHLTGSVTFRNVGASTLHISAVDLPGAPFSAPDAPQAGDTIAPGASLTVSVSFDPTEAGSFVDEIGLHTDGGDDAVGLTGSAGSPGRLVIHGEETAFGSVPVGATQTRGFTITNAGQTAVTITRSKPPTGGDFTATTALPEGTTIAAGQTLTETVAFKPSGTSFREASWSINGDDVTGLHTVHFTGGPLPSPSTLTVSRTVSAPAGTPEAAFAPAISGHCPSAFAVARLGPGQAASPALVNAYARASCTVSEDTPNEDGWTTTVSVNGGAPQPLTTAGFTLKAGANTVVFHDTWTPAPPDVMAAGWQLNGDASVSGGSLQLNVPTATYSRGSAFWPVAFDPSGATVEFDATTGPAPGADGLTLVFADADSAGPTALGSAGGRLGFGGIPGIAVALDTYKNKLDPSSSFVGISDGQGASTDGLEYVATAPMASAALRGTHHVKVTAAGGVLTVWVDGMQVVQQAVTLPQHSLIGFTGATGGLTDEHSVSNVRVTGVRYLPRPTLALRTHVVAPAGSLQAAGTASYVGSCSAAFEAGAQGNGSVARPGLNRAAVGQPCTLGVFLPDPTGWTASVSVGGGPARTLAAQDGFAFLPSLALAAGETTVDVTFTFTGTPTYALLASPRSLSFTATAGAAPPAAKVLTIYNGGTAKLPIAATVSAAWLHVTPASGTTVARPSVSVTTTGLAAGTYKASLRYTSPSAPAGLTVPVTLVVNPAPAPAVVRPAAVAPAPAPVAAWSFDERRGSVVRDDTGHGHNGVVHGARRVAGRYGGGLSFDGAGDWVTVPDSPALRLRRALTLEAWVRPSGRRSEWGTAILKQRGSGLAYGLYAPARGGRAAADLAAGGDRSLAARTRLRAGAWTHLAATWDGSTLRLYVNAVLVATRAVRGPLSGGGGPLRFGGNAVWSEFFRGTLDEVRIYDRALTAAQLRADRAKPVLAGTPARAARRHAVARSSRHRSRVPKPLRTRHRTV